MCSNPGWAQRGDDTSVSSKVLILQALIPQAMVFITGRGRAREEITFHNSPGRVKIDSLDKSVASTMTESRERQCGSASKPWPLLHGIS